MMTKINWEDRKKYVDTINNIRAKYAVTFNLNRLVARGEAEKTVLEFEKRLNRNLFGHKHRQHEDRIIWCHFYEVESGNSHFHSVPIVLPKYEAEFEKQAKHIWAKLVNTETSKGQLDFGNKEFDLKWASYMTKNLTPLETKM
jgi:hypothetical protein